MVNYRMGAPLRPVLRVNALYLIGVAVVFSLVSIFARLAFDSGSNALTVVVLRSVFAGAALWVLMIARGIPWRLPPAERNWSLALGALLAFATFALNKAIGIIPVAIAILIFYTYPLMVGIASWLTGAERFSLRVAVTLVLAFSGLALALQVTGGPLDPSGLAYAVSGAICWAALMYLSGRVFGGRDSQPHTLYMMLSSATLFVLACLVTGDVAFPATLKGWVGFAAVPLTYSVAIIGTMAAVSAVGAMKTSFYMNFDPVATIVFAAFVLDQYLTSIQLVGAVLVIVAIFSFRTPAAKAV